MRLLSTRSGRQALMRRKRKPLASWVIAAPKGCSSELCHVSAVRSDRTRRLGSSSGMLGLSLRSISACFGQSAVYRASGHGRMTIGNRNVIKISYHVAYGVEPKDGWFPCARWSAPRRRRPPSHPPGSPSRPGLALPWLRKPSKTNGRGRSHRWLSSPRRCRPSFLVEQGSRFLAWKECRTAAFPLAISERR